MNNLTSLHQEEDDKAVIIIVALALLGKRVPIRTMRMYLTMPDLTGNPRGTSAWNHLQAVGNDRAFITVMGVDVRTFEALLDPFSIAWDSTTITQSDVNPNGEPQPARRSLDASGGLALLLHWLSSSMAAYTLQQIFSITAAVCTRNLQHARACLLAVLWDLKIGRISWPSRKENCQYYSSLIEQKYPLLVKCFGFINGLNLPVNVADNEECVLCLFFHLMG
jgi:hypothetical protein